jgi:phenylacetate-coenzyme A ligase PaaK-like adenylate-forming protein
MPFIRYDLADYAEVLDDDSFPNKRIGKIYGRCDDIVYFGNNHTLTYHQSYQLFRAFHECEQYKFIEKSPGEIVLQLKVSENADKEKVRCMARQKWGEKYPDYPLTIEWRDSFPIDKKTGKFKVIEKFAN